MSVLGKVRLGWYFSESGQTSVASIMQTVRGELLGRVKSKQTKFNLLDIQQMLNDFYYPKTGSISATVQQFQDIMSQEDSKTIETVFQNFNFANTPSNFQSRTTVTPSTLHNTYLKAESNLKLLDNAIKNATSKSSATAMKAIQQQMQTFVSNAKALYQTQTQNYSTIFGNIQVYTGTTAEEAVKLVQNMAAFNAAINNGQNVNSKIIGDAFENSLAKAFSSFYNAQTNKMYNYIGSKVLGSDTVSRGVWQGSPVGGVSYSINVSGLNQNIVNEMGFTTTSGNATFSYKPGADKQSKVDVVIQYSTGTIKDPAEYLRISAKNWPRGMHKVGITSIDAGLSRAVGLNVAEYYRLAMLDSAKDYKSVDKKRVAWQCNNIAHDLAKLALASDIVMGENQGGNYADILVINTGSYIIVKDISDLVQNVKNLSGYMDSKIESEALRIYNNMRRVQSPGRTSTYLGLFASTLNKMKVSYNLNNK